MEKRKPSITKRSLKTLQGQLKRQNMQWVPLLIEQMKGDKEIAKTYRQVNDKKVYNVFNGIVKKHGVETDDLEASGQIEREAGA